MSSSMKKVCATGPGLARPVVSMITRSNLSLPCASLLREVAQDAHQVAAHGAAEAAVVHLDDLLFLVLHQDVVVDAGLAELVLDHGDLLAVLLGEDAVEQRGLPGAEEAGEDGDGDEVFLCGGLHGSASGAGGGLKAFKISATAAFFKAAGDEDQPRRVVIHPARRRAVPKDTACAGRRGRRRGAGSPAAFTRPFSRRIRSPRSSSSVSSATFRARPRRRGSARGPREAADARVVAAGGARPPACVTSPALSQPCDVGRARRRTVQPGFEEPGGVEGARAPRARMRGAAG